MAIPKIEWDYSKTYDYTSQIENYSVEEKIETDNFLDVFKYMIPKDQIDINWKTIIVEPKMPKVNFIMDSPYKQLFDILGFTIEDFKVVESNDILSTGTTWTDYPSLKQYYIYGFLICPCGRREVGVLAVHHDRDFDPYKWIYDLGAISIKHLRDDGFPEEFVNECEVKYKEAEAMLKPLQTITISMGLKP